MRHARRIAIAVLFGALPFGVSAQDVEMWGRRYGTRPPPSYDIEISRDPSAFEFARGRSFRARSATRPTRPGGPSLALGPRSGPVTGTFRIPLLLGLYANSSPSPPVTRDTIQTGYFGSQAGTISDYYAEVSGGRVDLLGDVRDWQQISLSDATVTGGESGLFQAPLGEGGAGNFVYELLTLQVGVDWGEYDNDGPDGSPNSGDDDGFVDVVAVLHPTSGGECSGSGGGDRIWSHRWSLSSAVFQTFVTTTPAFNGGFIQVDDYVIQPSLNCGGDDLNPIGIFTHELGHAFGLPDLYDTDGADGLHGGAGVWDLMSTGSWGCNNRSPSSPCHLGAWSKEMLGWANIVTLAPDLDHGTLALPPVEIDGAIYRIDANDGSGEYFLLENRQRVGYDQNLFSEGLLVWQIDADWVSARWGANTVNADVHRGVWLRQADGLDELGQVGGGRGDAGDPFPGSSGNQAFHVATTPGAISYEGGATGLTVFDIAAVNDDVEFRLLTRFTTITVRADGASGTGGLFTVNGELVDPPATTFPSAPFAEHTLEAVAGEPIQAGERRPFVEWLDDPTELRTRVVTTPLTDTEYVALYGGVQFELALTVTGGVSGVEPGTFVSEPASQDLWFASGASVTIEAVPQTGFEFLAWSGDLAGQGNPASLTLTGPVAAGADFDFVYAVASAVIEFPAATDLDAQLEVENGTAPYTWTLVAGEMPLGLTVSREGRITGASLETGVFDLTFEAVDAIGLPATGSVSLDLVEPQIPIEQLAFPFLLTGLPMTTAQREFLNLQGNGVGGYDVGDFRAWVLAHPSLPLSASFEAPREPMTIVMPMKAKPREDRR